MKNNVQLNTTHNTNKTSPKTSLRASIKSGKKKTLSKYIRLNIMTKAPKKRQIKEDVQIQMSQVQINMQV